MVQRSLLPILVVILVLILVAACAPSPVASSAISNYATSLPAQAPTAVATLASPIALPLPDCRSSPTLAQTEGPFYKGNTPERTVLVQSGMAGDQVLLTGYVLTRDCKPIAGAWLDFWQANDRGVYGNSGYTLRGHQFTDANGRYLLQTILPGLYPGRTRHIHVKVQAPGQSVLTTQLYFPEEPRNSSDSIYNPTLDVTWQDVPGKNIALFDFVLDVN